VIIDGSAREVRLPEGGGPFGCRHCVPAFDLPFACRADVARPVAPSSSKARRRAMDRLKIIRGAVGAEAGLSLNCQAKPVSGKKGKKLVVDYDPTLKRRGEETITVNVKARFHPTEHRARLRRGDVEKETPKLGHTDEIVERQ